MNLLDILIIISLVIFFYIFYFQYNKEKFTVKFKDNSLINNINDENYDDNIFLNEKKQKKQKKKNFKANSENYLDDIVLKSRNKINSYFQETQYNPDYSDTLDAFNNLSSQRIVFNPGELPIVASKPSLEEVKPIIDMFVEQLNINLTTEVFETNNLKGFNNAPNKIEESGWDKHQKQLGLPSSIYQQRIGKRSVKLLDIDKLEKYTTDNETKYISHIILQKKDVNDQIVVSVSFIMDTSNINLSRQFFDNDIKSSKYETSVKIQEIFVIGFLTEKHEGSKSNRKNFYNFKGLDNGVNNDRTIMNQLNKKRNDYMIEQSIENII
jgi:hypothetical protein